MTNKTNGLEILVGLANGTWRGELVCSPLLTHEFSPTYLSACLVAFVSEFLDKAMEDRSPWFVWCEHISYSAVDQEGRFVEYPGAYHRKALPGWTFAHSYGPKEQDAVLDIFDRLVADIGPIDRERVGKCPVCQKYFVVRRGGQRRSKACSREHGNILAARRLRSSPSYQEKMREKEAARIRAGRQAAKLVRQWIEEGRDAREREKLLRDWNNKKGAPLGKRAFYNVLEKGVVHLVPTGTL